MTGLADVEGFKNCIQVCVWLGFPFLIKHVITSQFLYTTCGFEVTSPNNGFFRH